MTKRGMMDQFFDIKEQHPDTVLFFRMGDFYELFHDDAEIAADVLGLSLTSRDKNAEQPIPMAGFPWHGLEDHLRTMLRAGYKVTLAEQEEELRPGAKLLERVVTRVYTPGSLYEEGLLEGDEQSLLAAVVLGSDALGLAVIDASTGKAWASTHGGADRILRLQDDLLRWQPSELVMTPKDAGNDQLARLFPLLDATMVSQHNLSPAKRDERLRTMLNVADLGHLDLDHAPLAISATGLAADYLATVHRQPDVPLQDVELVEEQGHLLLDQTTLRNLELTATLAGEYDGEPPLHPEPLPNGHGEAPAQNMGASPAVRPNSHTNPSCCCWDAGSLGTEAGRDANLAQRDSRHGTAGNPTGLSAQQCA